MPGAYAHLTLSYQASEPTRLEKAGIPEVAIAATQGWKKFVALGAVSPDLSYLKFIGGAAKWADNMHYVRSGEVIRCIARKIRQSPESDTRHKQLAWLLGYTLHVAADTTIHPVVQLKVGPYQQHKTEHRNCEMHQDVYIFKRLNIGPIGLGNFLGTNICACKDDRGKLDGAIVDLWEAALKDCYPGEFLTNPPVINEWYSSFNNVVMNIGNIGRLVPLARHVCQNQALFYPSEEEVNDEFIKALKTPRDTVMSYDALFDFARSNVVSLWASVADYVINGNDSALENILDLNLDTGEDSDGNIKMWE